MRITPQDKQRLASAGFVVTLGIVGWGFVAGWFTPQPVRMMKLEEDPSVTILPGDSKGRRPKPQPVNVRVRPASKPTGDGPPPRASTPIRLGRPEPTPPGPLFRPWEPEKPRTPPRAVAPRSHDEGGRAPHARHGGERAGGRTVDHVDASGRAAGAWHP